MMHIQPNAGLAGLDPAPVSAHPWGDNTQVRLCNRISSQIAGLFGSSTRLRIRQFALWSPSHSGQNWSQKNSLGSGFDFGCRAPCREGVQWQQVMLWSPSRVPQLAEHICPGAAGATAVPRHDNPLASTAAGRQPHTLALSPIPLPVAAPR